LTAAVPLTSPRPERQIWCIGGGKGGIGKSLLTAALGWQLARSGKRVVLVDADLGGANLHTCLGLANPSVTLGDFIRHRVGQIEDVLVETGFPGLGLISGASDILYAANLKYAQKLRVINRIRGLDVDVILLDLGAGNAYNTLDFFLISDVSLLAVVPEPTSIENGYRFIKSALYRRLKNVATSKAVRDIIDAALDQKNALGIRSPLDLVLAVEGESPEEAEALRREVAIFRPRFVVNQVRSTADISVGHQLVTACARHLGIRALFAGFVDYDDHVWQGVRQRRLFVADAPQCPAAQRIAQLARCLLRDESLTLPW
jgi:flagellar biosynthesis protein FlhG